MFPVTDLFIQNVLFQCSTVSDFKMIFPPSWQVICNEKFKTKEASGFPMKHCSKYALVTVNEQMSSLSKKSKKILLF